MPSLAGLRLLDSKCALQVLAYRASTDKAGAGLDPLSVTHQSLSPLWREFFLAHLLG